MLSTPTIVLPQPASRLRWTRSAPAPVALRGLRRFVASMSPTAWVCVDWLIIGLASLLAGAVLARTPAFAWLAKPGLIALTFGPNIALAGLVFGLYERNTLLSRGRILLRSTLTLVLGLALAFACLALVFYSAASRWIAVADVLIYGAVALPLRLYAHQVITTARLRLLCIGDGDSIRRLVRVLGHLHRQQYDVLGHVGVPRGPHRLTACRIEDGPRFRSSAELCFEDVCPHLGDLDELTEILATQRVDEVVVSAELAGDTAVGRAVALCLRSRCRVTDQATFVEKLLGEVPVENITSEWFLRADVQNRGNFEAVLRLLDVLVAALGLLLTVPLWPLIALAIRWESRGPALYRQIRVGRYGRCFTMYKFRTMHQDAERHGVRWAATNDRRVTRVGRLLRRTRLDEVPQLVNILRGDMSLVGPRPERPEFVHELEQVLPHYDLRHLTRPGLTGWAQINYGYGSSVADAHRKLCFDLYYLKHRSLELDLAILMRTFGTFALGAR